jgi:hypothetical protein
MDEVCLIQIHKQIGKKRSTEDIHGNADCPLKNTPTKQNKYVINQKLEQFNDISFREQSVVFTK